MDEERPLPPKRRRTTQSHTPKVVPLQSTLTELFNGGSPVWLKMGGGAFVAAIVVLKVARKSNSDLAQKPGIIALTLAVAVVLGAVVGASLTLKDIVKNRMDARQPVAYPLKVGFGFGIWSLLLVWVPVIFGATLAITMLTLP